MHLVRSATTSIIAAGLATAAMLTDARPLHAQQAVSMTITVQNDSFIPSELEVPANRPITIRIKNLDAEEIEFESVALRVEKEIAAKSEGIVNIRPLAPGRYEFFDDYHPRARGTLVVK